MRTLFLCFLTCLFGLAISLIINWSVLDSIFTPQTHLSAQSKMSATQPTMESAATPPSSADPISQTSILLPPTAPTPHSEVLMQHAYAVLNSLKSKDYVSFSSMIHPEKRGTFTPFSTVDIASNQVFRPLELSKL